ncbi:MAG TPA: Ig-like domain-containing protein, partial [Actinomycetota bacterium]|nr:Ig-like domain-containing protein [Actinomycetota bacterium]
MNINRTRGILAAAVVASLVLPGAAFNAIAARRTTAYAGSVTVHSPVKGEMIRRATTVEWSWRAGTYVKSTSRVDILASDGYQWYPVAISVPIRDGRFDWDTSAWPDEDYVVRVQVQRTTIRGTSAAFYIDNTAPSARISRPSQGEVLIENDTRIFFASVVGTARLEADVRDNLTGVKKVRWLLDGEQIGVGNPYTHNFSLTPGRHELTAISTDGAGNDSAPSTIVILCLPGPSIT